MKYSKDGITVAPMIDTGHPKLNGLYPISIRVTYQRRRKYYPTGKDLMISEWEQIETTKSHRLVCIRKDIEHSYNVVRDAVEELANTGCFTLDALNTRLKGAGSNTLNDAFREKITALKREKRIGSAAFYINVLQGIERYAGTHIRFNTVTPDWLARYSNFLRQEGKTQTTIAIHMRHTRAILNAAKRCGKITEAQFPFGVDKFKIQEGEGRKLALTLAQIGEIARYDNGLTAAAKYRDYWLFLYYCNGINVADFVKLKYSNIIDGEIAFVRQKTERTTRIRKEIRATLIEPMQAIIDRWGNTPMYDNYIFPILDGTETVERQRQKTRFLTRAINKHMNAIGQELGIGAISTYTARHSFATVLKRAGANIAYISESLGHQDLKTTENYLAAFEKEERQHNAELLTNF